MSDTLPDRPAPADPAQGPTILTTLIAAGLFLYVGFGTGLVGISKHELYNQSVTAFVWMGRIVGIGLLVVVVLTLARIRGAMLLDLVLATLAAAGCAAVGAIWIAYGDQQGFLVLIFAAVNGSAALSAWRILRNPGGFQ